MRFCCETGPPQGTFTIPDIKGGSDAGRLVGAWAPTGTSRDLHLNSSDARKSDFQSTGESSCDRRFANTFDLPISAHVRLRVYDLLGRELAILLDGDKPAGSHSVTVNSSALASGMYDYRLDAGNVSLTRKMMVLK